jgi:hypothetical protein
MHRHWPYDFTVRGALWAASPCGYPSSTHAVNPSSKSAGLLLKGLSASSHRADTMKATTPNAYSAGGCVEGVT